MKSFTAFTTILLIACSTDEVAVDPSPLSSTQVSDDTSLTEDFSPSSLDSEHSFDECSPDYQVLVETCQTEVDDEFFYSELEDSFITHNKVINASSFACCCTSCCSQFHP